MLPEAKRWASRKGSMGLLKAVVVALLELERACLTALDIADFHAPPPWHSLNDTTRWRSSFWPK